MRLDLLAIKLGTFGETMISNKQQHFFFFIIDKILLEKSSTKKFDLNIKLVESGTVPAQTPSKNQNVFPKRAKPAQK